MTMFASLNHREHCREIQENWSDSNREMVLVTVFAVSVEGDDRFEAPLFKQKSLASKGWMVKIFW